MKIIRSFPQEIKQLEHVWIPMSDGTRLGAKIWMPQGADKNPVPAVLEYFPYRKRDMVADRDATIHAYFAGHGYASIRVDIRGSGDSEGVLEDEYLAQEQKDGLEILRWIAAQPWSDGSIGMMGISWGGFNSLQLAALRPPQLKAIITVCSTDDRYADDVHYMGGCLLGDNLSWASTMFAFNSLPPDPELVGEAWRKMWFKRLEGSGLWLKKWLSHQRRDDFWKHGSVCEDYSAINCPVMAVSGWADGYSNAVFRLLSGLKVPRKGLVGPWSHKYPHLGKPGPAIGFLQEALRWWDTWLKKEDRGLQKEPMLKVWMQDSVPPLPSYRYRPGRWVAEQNWPSANICQLRYKMAPSGLLAEDADIKEEPMHIQSPLGVGLYAGKWCSYALAPDLPHDQRQEDGGALIMESAPLAEDLEILGAPVLDLQLSSNQPVAMIAARLSDVREDDSVTRVTYGLLNLTHRESHEHPRELEPGKRYQVRLELNQIAQNFPAGHRLRVSISTSYWPLAWPPPKPVCLSIIAGQSSLTLPVRPQNEKDTELWVFPEAEGAAPLSRNMLEPEDHNWRVKKDLGKDESMLEAKNDEGVFRLEHIDLQAKMKAREWYTFKNNDFDTVRGETRFECALKRRDWSVSTITRTVLTSDETHFRIRAAMDAYEGDFRVLAKDWDYFIARDKL